MATAQLFCVARSDGRGRQPGLLLRLPMAQVCDGARRRSEKLCWSLLAFRNEVHAPADYRRGEQDNFLRRDSTGLLMARSQWMGQVQQWQWLLFDAHSH